MRVHDLPSIWAAVIHRSVNEEGLRSPVEMDEFALDSPYLFIYLFIYFILVSGSFKAKKLWLTCVKFQIDINTQ